MQSARRLHRELKNEARWQEYTTDVREFLEYLAETKKSRITLDGVTDTGEGITVGKEYIHRWTDTYRKAWVAKLYQLDDWYQAERPPVTLLTLTTYQDGWYSREQGRYLSIAESFRVLKEGWKKLSMILRKELGTIDYLSVVEPHETGYPHMHVALFAEIPQALQDKIRDLWEQYGAGSQAHGVDFAVTEARGDISSVRNYLLKYLAKSLQGTGSQYGDEPVTPGEWVFHSQVWRHGYRLIGSSRNLSRVMAYRKEEEEKRPPVSWYQITMENSNGETRSIWTAKKAEASPPERSFSEGGASPPPECALSSGGGLGAKSPNR